MITCGPQIMKLELQEAKRKPVSYTHLAVYKRQEEARHRAVGMEIVHKIIVGIQIAVDERHTAGGTGHYIQPPVSVGVFIGFQ